MLHVLLYWSRGFPLEFLPRHWMKTEPIAHRSDPTWCKLWTSSGSIEALFKRVLSREFSLARLSRSCFDVPWTNISVSSIFKLPESPFEVSRFCKFLTAVSKVLIFRNKDIFSCFDSCSNFDTVSTPSFFIFWLCNSCWYCLISSFKCSTFSLYESLSCSTLIQDIDESGELCGLCDIAAMVFNVNVVCPNSFPHWNITQTFSLRLSNLTYLRNMDI